MPKTTTITIRLEKIDDGVLWKAAWGPLEATGVNFPHALRALSEAISEKGRKLAEEALEEVIFEGSWGAEE